MSSERKLSELARHLIQPTGIVRSAFPRVMQVAGRAGIEYDRWQQGLGTLILGTREDGSYAASEGGVVISICRQVGKTFTIGSMIFILCMLRPGLKVLWTAHRTRTSDETFSSMQTLARKPAFGKYVRNVRKANGQQEIEFANASRIMFGARENGFGRGFDGVDVEVFDEAQILKERALDDMIPAMNTARNPLVIFMGTPPTPTDPGEVFTEKRRAALKGADGMLYVEFSADRDADPDDRAQWRKANPSFPKRTSEAAILRMKNLLGEDSFRREGLGIWDEQAVAEVIGEEAWHATEVADPQTDGLLAFGVDMPPDRSALAIGLAFKHDDGTAFVSLQEYRATRADGVQWAVDWLADRWHKTAAVVIDAQSPAMSIVPDLQKRHVKVTVTDTRGLGQATGRMLDMIRDKTVTHLSDAEQPQLAAAAKGVTLRGIGPNGAVAWNKKGSDVEISPLQATTVALHGAFTTKRRPGRKQRLRRLA